MCIQHELRVDLFLVVLAVDLYRYCENGKAAHSPFFFLLRDGSLVGGSSIGHGHSRAASARASTSGTDAWTWTWAWAGRPTTRVLAWSHSTEEHDCTSIPGSIPPQPWPDGSCLAPIGNELPAAVVQCAAGDRHFWPAWLSISGKLKF
ncbi:hypothetical protein BS78_01G316500 [Paspalum vaginatum]|nr:hypothetical protein BS78_01G316500 [Paspalum vaginatum]